MAPSFRIVSADNRGPTDNSGLDTLWVVHLSERETRTERFLFSVSDAEGEPTADDVVDMINERAAGFDNYASAIDQMRTREVPHPDGHPTRRAVLLGYC